MSVGNGRQARVVRYAVKRSHEQLTVSSPPWSTRSLDIERTTTSFTLFGVDVLANLTFLSVQPRHAYNESKTKELEVEFAALMAMNRATPSTRLAYRCKLRSGGITITDCAEGSTLLCFSLNTFTDSSVRMFNDLDQTRCPMLLYFLLYGFTWKKKLPSKS